MRVDDSGDCGEALSKLLCNRKVVQVGAYRPHIDLRRQSEVQNLRHDIGRLEIERAFGKCSGQHLTQFLDIIGGRLMALLQLDLDNTVVDADRGTIRECQIVSSRRQSDIVDNELAISFRNDFADLVLHLLEYRLGAFDTGPSGPANVKLDLAAVDQREKIPPNENEHRGAEAEYQNGDNRYDDPAAEQEGKEVHIAIAQALEATLECGGHAGGEAYRRSAVSVTTLALEQQADRNRRQGPRQSV